MMPRYFDAHTHVNLAGLKEEGGAAIERALAAGVGMVNSGTDMEDSRLAIEMAHANEDEPVYASVGFHPEFALTKKFDYEAYKEIALDPKTVGIGECGLDYYRIENKEERIGEIKKRQREIFEEQIKLAHEVQKPLVIHCRDAFTDLIEILDVKYKILNTVPGLIHFFTGTKDEAKKLLDMGFAFTFGGAVTYPPKEGMPDYKALVEYLPLDRILSETDAPFVAPVPYRGARNEPAYVIETVKKLAEIKNVSVEEMAKITVENAERIFRL
ncbi:TatD family hydrolase [Patescibacteria group bacterium]|nr:TatD family hydrolase [Patescibacteria group bacterium]